jgi:exodeoxyribonuclease V alpha subunit
LEEQVVIEAMVEDIIYQNADNGYTVCSVSYEGEELSCVGSMLGLTPGEEVKIIGTWATHPVYGKQVKVDYFEKSIPKTVQGMERYLASGAIKGIGPKMATKIVKHFGIETFRIMEEEPLVLAQIKGITQKKAEEIGALFHAQYELRKAMLLLQEYGITPTYAIKIYKRYKDDTIGVIQKAPYRLAQDIHGIGFKKADEIAAQMGIPKEDPHRIKTGCLYLMTQFSNQGHTYIPKELLLEEAKLLLEVLEEQIENALLELHLAKAIVIKNYDGTVAIFLSAYYQAESYIATKLLELAALTKQDALSGFEKELAKAQKELGTDLVTEQKEAIAHVLANGLTIITGGPGTGKTTTINVLLHILEGRQEEVLLTAPTGRAAKRMSEATGQEAQTIHRLLEINYMQEEGQRQRFEKDEDNPLEADVVIIDEMSMVDVSLMHALVRAIAVGQRVVFIGDADQLPSVGPGNVLKDMIKSEKLPVVRLTQIFRQAGGSAIVLNAHRINNGEMPIANEEQTDFFMMNRAVQQEVRMAITELMKERLPKYQKVDPIKDIQVLSPMRKGLLGVTELNKALQEALNPPHPMKSQKEYRQTLFREGDKVMQIKNNYNTPWKIYNKNQLPIDEGVGVFNGDCGMITRVDTGREILVVTFEDQKTVEYEFAQLDELDLAYAVTIHKSQGSEYPVVILPLHSGPSMLLTRNLLYTAVTRAKQMVVIVGLKEAVERMVENNKEMARYSSLAYHLQRGL